jgi:hypothetical protein
VKSRKCAWLAVEAPLDKRVVWVRGNVFSVQCPKSIITADSLRYLEVFSLWRQLGGISFESLDAKTADALVTLQQAWQEENQDGEKQ